MTATERDQIVEFAEAAKAAISAIAKNPGKKERAALKAIARIKEVCGR